VERLRNLNAEIIARVVLTLPIRTLTCDVDGTVLSTGLTVERAFRGYNPHHRKVPSYYPISAYLAETGHFLRVKNRSGNVHDGKASITFLKNVFRQIAETLGSGYRLSFRMDGAFFTKAVLRLMERKKAGYAIKVPFWKWIDLQGLIAARKRWKRVNGKVGAFEKTLDLEPWGMRIRVVIYRKKVHHRTRKNYQLDLFDPDDGTWEYSAVATNLSYEPKKLWNFMAGRGAHEKAIGQLKSGLAFDTIPTHHYGANSAWQQIVVLAHNLLTNFQIETGVRKRSRSQKRTALHVLKSAQTLRFEIIRRAGQILRPRGTTVLRLQKNPLVEKLFSQINQRLEKAA
jgi:ribosomal protein L17